LFGEFVNSDPAKIRFQEIEVEMLSELQRAVGAAYGMEIKTLGIKQLKISEDVSKDIFERMRAERKRVTEMTIARGNAEATSVKSDADSKKKELLAAATARAKAIRGEGDAEAAKSYKMLEADPELAVLLRNLEALRKILGKGVTYVVPTDKEPFSLIKEIPNLKLVDPNALDQ
jgi:membrane protease subunit HflC